MHLGGFAKLQDALCQTWLCVPADQGTWQLSLTRKVTCHSPPLCSNTNTDSGVLVADIFNYLMSTFISSHLQLDWCHASFHIWSGAVLHRRRRGRRSQPFSSNFHVGVLDSAVALENTGTELWNAFKQSCFVNTNKTLVLVSLLLFNNQAIQFKQEVIQPGFQIFKKKTQKKQQHFFVAIEHNIASYCAVVYPCQ